MEKINSLKVEMGINPKVLILGTMPGNQSLEKQEYYSSPNNSFWAIISGLFNDEKPFENYDEKRKCLFDNHIALWDVYDSCIRDKSVDKSIKETSFNDIPRILTDNPTISLIIFNGKKAEEAFKKHYQLNVKTVTAPSTSNAFPMKREKKTELWKEALGLSKKEEQPAETPRKEEGTPRSLEMTISGAPYIITLPIMEDEWKKDAKKLIEECDEENGNTDFRVDFYANVFRDLWEDERMIVLYDEKEPVNVLIQDRETGETVDQFTQNDVPLKTSDIVLDAGDIFFIKKCEDAKSYFSAKTVYSRDVFSFTKVKVIVGDRIMEGLVPFDFADEEAFFEELFTDFEIYNSCDDYSDETEGLYINLNGNCTVIGEELRPESNDLTPDNNTQSLNNHQNAEKMNIRIEITGRGNLYNIVSPSYLDSNEGWKDAIKPLIEKSEEEGEDIESLEEFEIFSAEYMDDCAEILLYDPEEEIYVTVIDTDSDDVIDEFTSKDVEFTDDNATINGGYICRQTYVKGGQLAVELYDVEYSRDNFSFNKVSVKFGDKNFEKGIEVGYEYYDEEAEYDTNAMFDIEDYDDKYSSLHINLDGK